MSLKITNKINLALSLKWANKVNNSSLSLKRANTVNSALPLKRANTINYSALQPALQLSDRRWSTMIQSTILQELVDIILPVLSVLCNWSIQRESICHQRWHPHWLQLYICIQANCNPLVLIQDHWDESGKSTHRPPCFLSLFHWPAAWCKFLSMSVFVCLSVSHLSIAGSHIFQYLSFTRVLSHFSFTFFVSLFSEMAQVCYVPWEVVQNQRYI